MNPEQLQEIRNLLFQAFNKDGMWGVVNPILEVPKGVERGSDTHLAFLTLVYTISGGREPVQLWDGARQTFAIDGELFSPSFLAYAKPATLIDRLKRYGLTQKVTSEATTWQRIGQALMMRAGGSVQTLLADHAYDSQILMSMLSKSKATFPVLSGSQTAPRWLYGLMAVGDQPLRSVEELPIPVSPHAKKALASLNIQAAKLSARTFDSVDALGRYGCAQREPTSKICPVGHECPVATFCQYF